MRYLVCLAFLVSALWSSNVFAVTINAGNSPYNNSDVSRDLAHAR